MPRRLRWLVPIVALALPCAGADAATMEQNTLAVHAAQAKTMRALAARKQQRRERATRLHAVVRRVRAQLGDGYAYGASGPDAFDCSGLTAYAFARAGVRLPHTSYGQAIMGKRVARRHIRPGDLVFFSSAGAGASHVAIALSRGTAVSATNAGVMKHAIGDAYWGGHYVTARRLLR
jgi:cell wall-associated NlpC family hydrolase